MSYSQLITFCFTWMGHINCHNHNIGFTIKCELQGPMSLRMCLGVKHTFTMGENARDEAQ
jgi:hypothetical protein